jgi:hypothetical protein
MLYQYKMGAKQGEIIETQYNGNQIAGFDSMPQGVPQWYDPAYDSGQGGGGSPAYVAGQDTSDPMQDALNPSDMSVPGSILGGVSPAVLLVAGLGALALYNMRKGRK